MSRWNGARASGSELARCLLNPRSVALVGASDDAGKTAGRPLQYLRRAGFAGAVYPVNPSRASVQGEPAWPSLAALPEVPEHVFVLTPTDGVLPAVAECARLGVGVATVLASGFSEAGPEGVRREQALREIAAATGLRILGPNSIGVVHGANGLLLSANAAFAEPDLPALPGGRLFVASQSGSMIGALVSHGVARGVGFAGMVSVGSEADLGIGEICESTLDDVNIDGYLLFLESLNQGARLQQFARAAARRGKPVIAYKLGRSAAAAEMAATHTGALAGEDDVADAFLRDLGIARVGILGSLLETFPLARRVDLAASRIGAARPVRVGVVTTTGGGAAMAVDQLGLRDVVVEAPSAATLAKLAAAGLPGSAHRVLDLTLAGTRYEVMRAAIDTLLDAPEFDLVLAVVGSSARFHPQLAVKPIIDAAGHARPLALLLVPDAPDALRALNAAGVPCFTTPETCADAIAAVYRRRPPGPMASPFEAGDAQAIDEAEGHAVLARLGIAHAPFVVRRLSGDGPIGELPFAYPVAAKLCSAQVPHKTDVGGVVLGIGDAAALEAARDAVRRNLARRAPGVTCDALLIQAMCHGLGEVLLGYRVDAQAGPIVMLAAGGIWAEVARDRSIRLAPVDLDTARAMVAEVRALRSLTGLRGQPRGDLEALARAVSALSQLALRPELRIAEIDVNPLLVRAEGEGVVAVDALVRRVPASPAPPRVGEPSGP